MTREELLQIDREQLIGLVLDAQAQRAALDARLQSVEQQIRWFQKQLFGAKSKRRIVTDDSSQLCLGEAAAPSPGPTPAATPVRGHTRRKSKVTDEPEEPGLRFDESVPVETIQIPNHELEGLPEDGCAEVSEKINYRLAQKPGAYVVLKIVRKTVKRKDTEQLLCPAAPASVLEKSYADVSLLAGMLVDKFRYHLPLYRQHQRMRACGLEVSRSSLSNWVKRSIELLEPIYREQLASILESQVLSMDETPIRAGRKAKGKMRTGYFWPVYGDRDEVAFPYASSRAQRHVEEILMGYDGTLLSDGYSAYGRYAERHEKLVHALCWVHARRGFVKALDVEPERSKTALDFIATLYEHEEVIQEKELEGVPKLEVRAQRSKPVVEALFVWLEQELVQSALLPTNPFTKAALYALDRKKGLEVFLADPDVPLDTNHLERALRVIPMGRKNWLFCWTEVGAHQVGQIQSLLATCVLHDVDPYTYLVDVLQRVAEHPQSKVDQLTPRLWKEHFADAPLRSMLERTPR